MGSEKAIFEVHERQLCDQSSFFNAALNSGFKESSERVVALPDDDVDTVDLFAQWLYSAEDYTMSMDILPEDDSGDYLMPAMKLLIFAEKYDVQCLIGHTMGYLAPGHPDKNPDFYGRPPSQKVIAFVYANTPQGSEVRDYVVDWCMAKDWVTVSGASSQRDWLMNIPEFAADLVLAFAQAKNCVSSNSDDD